MRSPANDLKMKRRLDTIKEVSITSHTRPALRPHSQPLTPYKGILPAPGAVLRTVLERKEELSKQAEEAQLCRHIAVDFDQLSIRAAP